MKTKIQIWTPGFQIGLLSLMSVLGIGVDLVENARIQHSLDRFETAVREMLALMQNYKGGNLEARKP